MKKMLAVLALILMASVVVAWSAGDPAGPPASNGSGYATSNGGLIIVGIDNSVTVRFNPNGNPPHPDVHFPAWLLRQGPFCGEYAFSCNDERMPDESGHYHLTIMSNQPAPPNFTYSVTFMSPDGNSYLVESGTF